MHVSVCVHGWTGLHRCRRHLLALSAENDVDPVSQRSVFLWDGEPGLPAHDHNVLLPWDTNKGFKVIHADLLTPGTGSSTFSRQKLWFQ